MIADLATLDDPRALTARGAATMLHLAGALGGQLGEGYRAGGAADDLPAGDGLRSVVLCGMGGSGIAGDIVRALYADRLPLPVAVVKGYSLPEFCGRDTLVLAASFSGETEETLAAYAEAVDRGCRVVTMSAGGELERLAREDQVSHVGLPADVPVPRAALGFAAGVAIGVLDAMELVPPADEDVDRASRLLRDQAPRLGPDRPAPQNDAKAIAAWIDDRVPLVWAPEGIGKAAALRWKTQMNENAKVPAFAASFPELDHNEIEGWSAGAGAPFAVMILRSKGEHPRVAPRVAATIELVRPSGLQIREVHAEGTRPLETLLSLVMTGDFVSTYLGVLRGVDPLEIPVLTDLKRRLRG